MLRRLSASLDPRDLVAVGGLVLLAWGVAVKMDIATAAIVVGAVLVGAVILAVGLSR